MNFDEVMNRRFKSALKERAMDDAVYVFSDGSQKNIRVAITRDAVQDDVGGNDYARGRLTQVQQTRILAMIQVEDVSKPLREETFTSLGIAYRVVKSLERDANRSMVLVEEI